MGLSLFTTTRGRNTRRGARGPSPRGPPPAASTRARRGRRGTPPFTSVRAAPLRLGSAASLAASTSAEARPTAAPGADADVHDAHHPRATRRIPPSGVCRVSAFVSESVCVCLSVLLRPRARRRGRARARPRAVDRRGGTARARASARDSFGRRSNAPNDPMDSSSNPPPSSRPQGATAPHRGAARFPSRNAARARGALRGGGAERADSYSSGALELRPARGRDPPTALAQTAPGPSRARVGRPRRSARRTASGKSNGNAGAPARSASHRHSVPRDARAEPRRRARSSGAAHCAGRRA